MTERARHVGRPLILVADDDIDTREMYALYLNAVSYNVKTAGDGQEAVLTARALHPDLIVIDLQMPKVDGWSAIRQLQSDPKTATIPVIVVTGHDFKTYLKHAAVAEGACSYLMKPILPEQLAREISTRLEERRHRSAGTL